MTKPQQPELRRSGRGATAQDSAKAKASTQSLDSKGSGPVPPGNRPGWQDRETTPPTSER